MGSGAPMYSSLSIRPAPGLSPPKKAAGKGGMKAGKMFRVQRPKRKTKKEPADKETSPDPGPLSQMTGEITMVPVRDMEAFVNRPIVDRHQEVVVHGKIKRPMNSFMLYRSAYTDLAKAWLCQNSNQDVSKVMGKSWSKESPFIRQKYESLANIERENHVRAHPNYKFAPRKDKGRGPGEDGVSEFDDPDYIPGSFAARMAQPHARDSSFDSYGSRDSTPFDGAPTHGLPLSEGFYSFQSLTSNPDRPMMSASPEPHQYIQASIRPSPMGAHVEDVFCRPGLQDMQYTSSSELTGLPGGPHYMLQTSTPAPANADGQLDPRLLSFESESSVANPAYHQPNYPAWQDNRANHAYLPVPSSVPQSPTSYPMVSGPYQHGMQSIMDHGSYESGHEAGAEASGDFDRWTDPHSPGY